MWYKIDMKKLFITLAMLSCLTASAQLRYYVNATTNTAQTNLVSTLVFSNLILSIGGSRATIIGISGVTGGWLTWDGSYIGLTTQAIQTAVAPMTNGFINSTTASNIVNGYGGTLFAPITVTNVNLSGYTRFLDVTNIVQALSGSGEYATWAGSATNWVGSASLGSAAYSNATAFAPITGAVTNNGSGYTLGGAFSGDGSSLTNITVSSTNTLTLAEVLQAGNYGGTNTAFFDGIIGTTNSESSFYIQGGPLRGLILRSGFDDSSSDQISIEPYVTDNGTNFGGIFFLANRIGSAPNSWFRFLDVNGDTLRPISIGSPFEAEHAATLQTVINATNAISQSIVMNLAFSLPALAFSVPTNSLNLVTRTGELREKATLFNTNTVLVRSFIWNERAKAATTVKARAWIESANTNSGTCTVRVYAASIASGAATPDYWLGYMNAISGDLVVTLNGSSGVNLTSAQSTLQWTNLVAGTPCVLWVTGVGNKTNNFRELDLEIQVQ